MSIILTMPTIIVQFPGSHEQNNGFNFSCVHCGQYNLLQTNNIKEEKIEIKEDVIDIKEEEEIDIKEEEEIDIKEEEEIDIEEEKEIDIEEEEEIDIEEEEEIDIEEEEEIDIEEEESNFDFEMDEYILHKDPNLYTTMFSPISNAESEDIENNESSVSEDQDENFDDFYKKWFNDISEIVQYLKEDVI